MISLLGSLVTEIGWRLPAGPGTGRSAVTLMYHGVPRWPDTRGVGRDVFEQQIVFLKRHFDFTFPGELNEIPRSSNSDRIRLLLTFDDGFLNNAEVVAPVLKKHDVPAVFFVATRHLESGKYLWFAYLAALKDEYRESAVGFRGETFDFSSSGRAAAVSTLRERLLALKPHPRAMYEAIASELPAIESFTSEALRADRYAGMSHDHLRQLAAEPLFTVGGHTADHPMLTLCTPQEQRTQIEAGKRQLEKITGRTCDLFAYPADDHDGCVRALSAQIGFRAAFTVHRTDPRQPRLTIPRVGVYHPGLSELGFKIRWSGALRQIQLWKSIQN